MACIGVSSQSWVRIIVFSDLAIALVHTIYRVTTLSVLLKRLVGVEKGKLYDEEFNKSSPEHIKIMKYSTVFLITSSVVGLAVEIFLFFLLNNGARSKNYRHCKHWFIIRILLLMLSILGSIIERVREQYKLIDGLMEAEKLYRIITLLVVRSFMKEIYKGMSDNNYEYNYNNSGGGDGYPNGTASANVRSQNSHSHSNF